MEDQSNLVQEQEQSKPAAVQSHHTNPHPHSLLLFGITGAVLVLTLGGAGYYQWQRHLIGSSSTTTALSSTTDKGSEASNDNGAEGAASPEASATASESPTPVPTSAPEIVQADSVAIKKDLAAVDMTEIKSAVTEIKSVLAAFGS